MASKRDAYKEIYEALDNTGLPWERVNGKKHVKVYLSGHLIGILPHGKASSATSSGRATKNFLSRIRKAADSLQAA